MKKMILMLTIFISSTAFSLTKEEIQNDLINTVQSSGSSLSARAEAIQKLETSGLVDANLLVQLLPSLQDSLNNSAIFETIVRIYLKASPGLPAEILYSLKASTMWSHPVQSVQQTATLIILLNEKQNSDTIEIVLDKMLGSPETAAMLLSYLEKMDSELKVNLEYLYGLLK